MDYDVFLSCSSDNNLPHENRIREQLEQRGYRVCYPPRDFVAGELIYDNIYNAVVRSKRTVCFLTEQFIQRFVLLSVVFYFNFVCVKLMTRWWKAIYRHVWKSASKVLPNSRPNYNNWPTCIGCLHIYTHIRQYTRYIYWVAHKNDPNFGAEL